MRANIDNFIKRRKTFLSKLPDNSVVVLPNKNYSIRSNDVEYRFRPDNDFYYLTGFEEPGAICVLKRDRRKSSYFLFVEGRDKEKEIWTGKRYGVEGAKSVFKADKGYLLKDFYSELRNLIFSSEYVYYALGKCKELDSKISAIINEARKSNRAGLKAAKAVCDPSNIIHKMRLIKDKYEISCIQKAADISKTAHILAMAYAKSGIYEYELEALIEYKFRESGAYGPAYPSIVGSGENSTVLHYINNSRKIKKQDLILIDAGSEYNYYASDLTRTYPENKKFNSIQRDLYEIVLESQLKSISQIKPGKRFIDSYNIAVRVLVEGLKGLKLLRGSTEDIIKKRKYKKFFMHKLGHWLGLDVHDAGPYVDEKGNSIKLEPGMVMTVEPGLYISSDMDDVPTRFHNVGIRIEDDILITKDGNKVLTKGVPKTISEIEAFSLDKRY